MDFKLVAFTHGHALAHTLVQFEIEPNFKCKTRRFFNWFYFADFNKTERRRGERHVLPKLMTKKCVYHTYMNHSVQQRDTVAYYFF